MTALGAVFRPQLAPERLRGVARSADAAGLEELWLWEDCFFESGIASMAAALAWTDRLRVGVGLMPVPLRNVALMAMETATLHRLFPDRVRVGVGHGLQRWMAQAGAKVDSPVTLLREYLEALRALLRGERVSTEGRYVRLDDVALDWPPSTPPEILVGTAGPRSLRVAGAAADGIILDGSVRPDRVRSSLDLVREGGATAPKVVTYLTAATGPDATDRVEREIAAWDETPIPEYADGVTAASVARAVTNLAEAGADTVVLQHTADEPDPEGFVRFVAEEVRPLVP